MPCIFPKMYKVELRRNPSGQTCGADPGLAVTPEYASLCKFTGKIYK